MDLWRLTTQGKDQAKRVSPSYRDEVLDFLYKMKKVTTGQIANHLGLQTFEAKVKLREYMRKSLVEEL